MAGASQTLARKRGLLQCALTQLVAREAHFSKNYQVPLSCRLGTMGLLEFRIFREYFGLCESACKTFFAKSFLRVIHKVFFVFITKVFGMRYIVAMSYRALKTAGTGCFGKKVNITVFSAKEEKFSVQNCVNHH